MQSYEEIMDKASRGNMQSVHTYMADITGSINTENQEENLYTKVVKLGDKDASPVFLYGKAVFKDKGRKWKCV